MRYEGPGWVKRRKPCPGCREIDETGISTGPHTCGAKMIPGSGMMSPFVDIIGGGA